MSSKIFYKFECSDKKYKEALNFQVPIQDTIKIVNEFKKAIRYVLFVMIIFLNFCSLSRCFIFLFSIQKKQVHSVNMESSIIANIFTQISFLGVIVKLRPRTRYQDLGISENTRDPGTRTQFFFIFLKFSSDNFENVNFSVFKPLLDKITL